MILTTKRDFFLKQR